MSIEAIGIEFTALLTRFNGSHLYQTYLFSKFGVCQRNGKLWKRAKVFFMLIEKCFASMVAGSIHELCDLRQKKNNKKSKIVYVHIFYLNPWLHRGIENLHGGKRLWDVSRITNCMDLMILRKGRECI